MYFCIAVHFATMTSSKGAKYPNLYLAHEEALSNYNFSQDESKV